MMPLNIRVLFGNVLDWLYPPRCVCCGAPGSLICDECSSQMTPVGTHFCSVCGKPLKPRHFCKHCAKFQFRFNACRAPYLYEGPTAAMIKGLKYNGTLGLVPILSKELVKHWQKQNMECDLVVPVPLSRKRKAERGFNQSEMLAVSFAKAIGMQCEPRALMKSRDTLQQVGLNAEERQENLKGAFDAEPAMVTGKRILLIDDVMTTGATFSECSGALLDAGAKSVTCLSVATTRIDHGKKLSGV